MAKPSIFSRDYEKIMRKRKKRRNIIVLLSVLILTVSIIIIKYDMQKISATFKNIAFSKELRLSNFRTENINLPIDDYIVTLKVVGNNDNLEIVDIKCDKDLISIDINKDRVLIIDDNQKIYLINAKKEIIDLTLDEYATQSGERVSRSEMLNNNSNYLWHTNGKIVNDEKIAYVTNIPEFNGELQQCIAVVTVDDNTHNINESLKGDSVKLYKSDENGLKVEIDGNIMYITSEE
ncbi:hypothetical protein [uncultured Clostridium sp.]|uniref:hypothetical protein n=1 Tax=uncultured Clostridium sp. TaxID=59620 RepID=UPI0025D59303|nr:hypothetical protein [uncultured Clostridium sp.]